jgi:tRNA(Ile)-lysidine synthase
MISEFKQFIEKDLKVSVSNKILLTISGGADSVTMLHLFSLAGYNCGIAHCNFHLRGEDSDLDEELVHRLAKKYCFPYYKIDFDTTKYSSNNGISIEMAARELRYTWFEKIRLENDYQYIATAHHQDDLIETFFLNLTRGTGIRGLTGFVQKRNSIIRPLLFANRLSITNYVSKENLEYREDKSNSDVNIKRNNLRHKILPLLNELNPASGRNILQSIKNLQDAEYLMNNEVLNAKKNIFTKKEELVFISITKLSEYQHIYPYLYELLFEYGFNSDQVLNIKNSIHAEAGKVFLSKSYKLIKDRDTLIIEPIKENQFEPLNIEKYTEQILLPNGKNLNFKQIEDISGFCIPKSTQHATLDFNKLKFPLIIRKWEQGDYFIPFGMKQKKKISDFLIDEKVSLQEKQNVFLLISEEQIVWIIGYRIDNRYKITDESSQILAIEIE